MPPRTPKRCRKQGCGNRTTSKYCDDHKHLESSWNTYARQQSAKGKRVYQTPEWRRLSPEVKRLANHLCLNCLLGQPSVAVRGVITEHLIPVSKGGDESYSNLSCFCKACADEKTGWEKSKSREAIMARYGHTAISLNRLCNG